MKRKATVDTDEDDDAPLSSAELARMRPVAAAKKVRLALGLSQARFAARYGIPLGTLRDWEQHKAKPDRAALTLLRVIAQYPETVERAVKEAA